MRFFGSVLFSAYTIIATIITALIAILLSPFPYSIRYVVFNIYAKSVMGALSLFCGIRYRVEGKEHIPQQPCIIFCKHQSTWETFALQVIFPPVSFVFKDELLWIPFFGWGLAAMRPIAIKRGAGRKAIKQLVTGGMKRLKENLFVVIFPEGTRTKADGPGRYHIGGAILASKSGYPVIPVAHHAGEFWPRKGFVKRPGTITVRIGPVLSSENKSAEIILDEAKTWIEAQMPELTQSDYQDRP